MCRLTDASVSWGAGESAGSRAVAVQTARNTIDVRGLNADEAGQALEDALAGTVCLAQPLLRSKPTNHDVCSAIVGVCWLDISKVYIL